MTEPATLPLVQPHEVRTLPPLDPQRLAPLARQALDDVVTACNGFAYGGARLDTLADVVNFLRHHPEHALALDLGQPLPK